MARKIRIRLIMCGDERSKRSERGGENVPTLGIRKENAGESRAKLNRVYCRAMPVANRREKRMTRDRGEEQQDSVTDIWEFG